MGARVALIGMGAVGRLLVPLLLDRGHTLVAAVGRGSALGRDAGELAGLAPLGLPVRGDLAAALEETRPEVALMSTASTLAATAADLEACFDAGCSVVTAAEEGVAPWADSPGLADRLHARAIAGGAAMLASGHLDALWVHLPLVLTGIANRVTALEGECVRPFASTRSANAVVAGLLGRPVEEYPVERRADPGPGAAHQSLRAIAAGMRLTVVSAESRLGPATSDAPIVAPLHDGERRIEPGTIAGSRLTVRLETAEGVSLVLHDTALLGAGSSEHWRASGAPDVELSTSARGGLASTATQMLNRIPDALAAAPGLHPLSELPPLVRRPD